MDAPGRGAIIRKYGMHVGRITGSTARSPAASRHDIENCIEPVVAMLADVEFWLIKDA